MRSWKQRLWELLHSRPYSLPPAFDPVAEANWLAEFTRQIECAGCRRHWKELLARHPPELSSRPAYFRWTVCAHNEINGQLEKPAFPLRAALRKHVLPVIKP